MLSHVYVFAGNPFLVHYLKKEWVRKFREKYGTEGISTFDLVESGESERLLQELTMQSFFVTKRLLVVNGNPFAGPAKKSRKKKVMDGQETSSPLLEGLDLADEETIIVFTEEGGGTVWPEAILPSNLRQLSAVNGRISGYDPKLSLSYEGFFSHLFGDGLSKEALSAVVRALEESVRKDEEADLFAAFHALEQIALLPKSEQTRNNAITFLDIVPQERGYELVSTILSGRAHGALGMLEGLLQQGIHPRQIFRMVSTQVLDLVKAKALQEDHPSLSESGLAVKLGKTAWQGGKIATTAKKTDGKRLAGLQESLIGMNVAMNDGGIDTEREEDFLVAFATLILRSAGEKGSVGNSNKLITGSARTVGLP